MSDKPEGGRGGRDIYKVDLAGKGQPENLGPAINTPYGEEAVFLMPDGKTLYFSSEGHNSMGGYDIFKSTLRNGQVERARKPGLAHQHARRRRVFRDFGLGPARLLFLRPARRPGGQGHLPHHVFGPRKAARAQRGKPAAGLAPGPAGAAAAGPAGGGGHGPGHHSEGYRDGRRPPGSRWKPPLSWWTTLAARSLPRFTATPRRANTW
ncbi:MAG: hypothetical protein WKG07_17270 [Hymenobacter sp.]